MRPIRLACLIAVLAAPAPLLAQETTVLTTACAAPRPAAGAETAEPDLHGSWDFHMDVGGSPSFGVLSVGWIDGRYGGTLSPVSTAPVVVRTLTLTDRTIRMVVASREGDVTFDGMLSPAGDRMCGTVAYHGGQRLKMVAQKRPQRRYSAAASPPGTSAAPSRGTSAPGGR